MTSSRRKKYHLGRAQKSRHREQAGRVLLECGVNDYLTEPAGAEGGAAVMTVPANRTEAVDDQRPMAQMHLWNQPVSVAPEPVREAPAPVSSGDVDSQVSEARTSAPVISWATSRPDRGPEDQLTLRGIIKGCGIGLAAAAAMALIYVLIH